MDQTIIEQSISVNELKKLYGINIPIDNEIDYYIGQLEKAGVVKHDDMLEILCHLEAYKSMYPDGHKQKMQFMDNLINYLKGTKAFERMQAYDTQSTEKITSLDKMNEACDEGELFVSVDMRQANHQVLEWFDPGTEVGAFFQDLCDRFGVPLALRNSKAFRQHVHGNLNPKRAQSIQAEVMLAVRNEIINNIQGEEARIVFQSHDEIVVACRKSEKVQSYLYGLRLFVYDKNNGVKYRGTFNMGVKFFEQVKVAKGEHVRTYVDDKRNPREIRGLKELRGVPGNRYYLELKRHLLPEEPIDERDLMFINDGRLAKWVL